MKKYAPVLLADDDENDVFLMQAAFRRLNLPNPLHTVRHGLEAIQYLAGEGPYADRKQHPRPYLLLLDLKMPFQDGFAVLEWLQAHPGLHKLVKVVLTSSNDPRDAARAQALGADACFGKPISHPELLALVRACHARWLAHSQRSFPEDRAAA